MMKPFLLAVALWLTVTFGCAAPSGSGPVTYHMLSTRDFLVGTDGTVYTRIVPTGATNYFTNLYQTFNNVTNFYTNLYQTFNIVTNVYTNVYQTFNSVTNLYENSFISYSNTYVTINGTNLAVVNPTDNYLPKRNSATNFVDSLAHDDGTVFSVDGSGTSFVRLESDNGEVIFGTGSTNILYRYVNSLMYSFDGVSGYLGATNPLGWIKIGTVSGSPAISASSTIFVDQQAVTHSINPALDNTYSLGDGSSVGAWADLFSKGYFYSEGFNDGLGNQSWLTLHHSGTNGSAIFNSHGAGTAGTARPISLEFEGVNLFQFDRLGQLTLGPGTTNVLYRSGGDLIYTNGSTIPVYFGVKGSSGTAYFGETAGSAIVQTESGKNVWLSPDAGNSGHVIVNSQSLTVDTDNHFDLGSSTSNGAWKDSYFKGHQRVIGHNDGAGNYTWLDIYHGGTSDGIHFGSQSAGTDGNPRPMFLDFSGATQLTVKTNGGLLIGPNTASAYPASGSLAYSLIQVNDVNLGDQDQTAIKLETRANGSGNQLSYLRAESFTNHTEMALWSSHPGTNADLVYIWAGAQGSRTNATYISLAPFQYSYTFLDPTISLTTGTNATSARIGTVDYITDMTANLLLVQNAKTNQFRIAPLTGYTGSGTQFFSDDGTFKGGITTNISGGGLTLTIVNGLITAVTAP